MSKRYELEIEYKDGTRRLVILPAWMRDGEIDRQIELRANSGKVTAIRLGYNGAPCRTVWEA